MNSLTKVIESAIKNAIEEYTLCISSKYSNVDVCELENIWNEVSKSMQISVSIKKDNKTPATSSSKTAIVSPGVNSGGCPYKFIKGARQDEICGSKPKDGNVYCSRHKKLEGVDQTERKVSPDPKRGTVKPKSKAKSHSPENSVNRVLRKHKTINKLYHQETGLVFRSARERVVIGKIVDDKLIDLTNIDIDECRKWGFAFDPINDDELENDLPDDEKDENVEKETSVRLFAPSSSASGQKFWECKVSGTSYTTRHGKSGNEGTIKSKTFTTHSEAVKEMNKMVSTKMKKGYDHTEIKTSHKKPVVSAKKNSKYSDSQESSSDETNNTKGKFLTPSDIEDELNELQGDSEDNSDDEEKAGEKVLGKEFIRNAIGLSKKTAKVEEEEGDDDEDMLIEEGDDDEDDEDEEDDEDDE